MHDMRFEDQDRPGRRDLVRHAAAELDVDAAGRSSTPTGRRFPAWSHERRDSAVKILAR
jgi:hypothetical protein